LANQKALPVRIVYPPLREGGVALTRYGWRFLWGGAKGVEGRPKTLQENPAKPKALLARLKKGEGLF
jgi:hypothetical protein